MDVLLTELAAARASICVWKLIKMAAVSHTDLRHRLANRFLALVRVHVKLR